MKIKKSQIAGLLFGVAMGISFSVMLGTVGFVMGVPFVFLGSLMFRELDKPKSNDENKKNK